MLFANYPQAVERYYSTGLYPAISWVMHPVLNLFPFSIGDIIYLLVIGYLLYSFIRFAYRIFKGRFKLIALSLTTLVIGIQLGILAFYLFWGMNYFRPSAAERLNLRDTSYTTAHLINVTCMLIDSANATRARLTTADSTQNNKAIYKTAISAVKNISDDSINFRAYSPRIKSSLLTPLLNYIGTSGYFNPFTGEAQLNYQMPYFARPMVACHEMSHQMGYGPEDEASFAGYIVALGSKDRLLRYSAFNNAVNECMHALRGRDTLAFKELRTHISAPVRHDFYRERFYWLSFHGNATLLSGYLYDDFLKANNQPQGLRTYNQMVLLLMNWYKE
ncbi:DUF3810 domain-containing protein [Mucilaginibacter puniceus]